MTRTSSALATAILALIILKLTALIGNVNLAAPPLWYEIVCLVLGLVDASLVAVLVMDMYKGRL